jgi:hypothetical protein
MKGLQSRQYLQSFLVMLHIIPKPKAQSPLHLQASTAGAEIVGARLVAITLASVTTPSHLANLTGEIITAGVVYEVVRG